MPELKAYLQATALADNSTRPREAVVSVTDYCAHAYVQEYQVTSSEDVTVWSTSGDPGYADFIMLRIEVLAWGSLEYICPIQITSGSGTMLHYILKPFDFFDIWSVDVWNDQSNGGSPDTIDEVKILGTGGLFGGLQNPITVRVTAYAVES